MKTTLFYALLAVLILHQSCNQEDTITNPVKVIFGFSPSGDQKDGRAEVSTTPASLRVTIENSAGEIVLNNEKVDLILFENSFVSEPVSLIPDDYVLTAFFV